MIDADELGSWGPALKKVYVLPRHIKAFIQQTKFSIKWPGFWQEANSMYFSYLLIDWPKSGVFLDIGAGASPFSTLVGNTHEGIEAWRADALYIKELNDIPNTMSAELDKLEFGDETVDAITIHRFHVIREDVEALREALRVLKTGGQIIINPFVIEGWTFPPTLRFWRAYTKELFLERLAPVLSECAVEFVEFSIKTARQHWALKVRK